LNGDRPHGDRTGGNRPGGDRPTEFIPKLDQPRFTEPELLRPATLKPSTTPKPPAAPRPQATRKPPAPAEQDATQYIPKVEDAPRSSRGDDEYQPRHGDFADLGLSSAPTTKVPPVPPPPPFVPGPRPSVPVGPPVYGADDRTEEHHFGTAFDSGFHTGVDSGFHTGVGEQPPVAQQEPGRTVLRTIGEVFITAGMVVLLFVVYELYVTNIFSAQKQASATTALDKEWDTVVGAGSAGPQRANHYDLTDGSGIAKIYIPSLGQDYHYTVIEGVTQADLAIGPGHYPGSPLPGQPGDFAVAGHRVGEGAPFNELDLVQSCDAIVIETQADWYVYRMLPKADEVAGWASGKGRTSQCSGTDGEGKVQPLGGVYKQTVGQEIVSPDEGDVVAPVPHHNGLKIAPSQEAALLTLTTCHPKFSAKQRLIVHAVLVKDLKKNPGNPDQLPPELKETS
jgi:sortase (surface protein transpeptidase)